MLDIGKELQTLLSGPLAKEVESQLEGMAASALGAMEPVILAAIKAELTALLGITL